MPISIRRLVWFLLVAFLFVAIAVIWLAFFGTGHVPEESELNDYPQLEPFVGARTGFKGIACNPRAFTLEFEFGTPSKSAAEYFGTIHPLAMKTGWQLVSSSPLEVLYRRGAGQHLLWGYRLDDVLLTFNPADSSIHVSMNPAYR